VSEDEEEDEEEDSEEERSRKNCRTAAESLCSTSCIGTIAMMESQIETMRGSIAALKGAKPPKDKKKKKEKTQAASSSKSSNKTSKTSSKKKAKKPVTEDDVLTFEQKKDLSEAIGKLDGARLEKVINIIHEGVPEIKDVSMSVLILGSRSDILHPSRVMKKSNLR
jgi:bromodomain-containing factor 1